MPQIIIEQPGIPPITVPLKDREVHLGRADDNDVVLVAEEVSRHHAKLSFRAGQTIVIDLNSLNGTYVNRQRVVERVLSHMDEIWFGSQCKVVFRDDTRLGQPAQDRLQDSTLTDGIAKIREEMDRLGSHLTLIGKRGATPPVEGVSPGVMTTPGEAAAAAVAEADVVTMSRAYRRLDALYKASKVIASDFDLSKRLAAVLDTVIEALEAERGFIMLRDEEGVGLRVSIARRMGQDLEASSPSMGIAGRAAIDGEPVLMEHGSDSRFSGRESIIQQKIASAMCVPLRCEDHTLGSIYVDTRQVGHSFTEEDLELFSSLAAQSAMAIENVRLYGQMLEAEKKRANLGRFLSPAIVEAIMKEDTGIELGGRKARVTTMFGDIRGATTIAERIPPTELVALLNEHFTALTEIVFQHKGTLDKYVGDEIMAVFGAPISASDDEERAVRAALAMQARNADLNQQRAAEGRPVLEIGIGIDTGEVIAGYIGSPERMDFTVVGDPVNIAHRLCSMAAGGQVVVGEMTYEAVKHFVSTRSIGTVMLKGKETPVHAYEVLGLSG